MQERRIEEVLVALERWGAARDWVGPDPYEGLNSPLGRIARGRRQRQAVTQAYKRLPISPPWPLRAPPAPNSMALAFALSAYSTPAGRELGDAERFLASLPAELRRLNLLSGGAAWGYHFDVQTRGIFYPATEPNAIATTFVAGALLDAHAAGGEPELAELALRSRPFLLSLRADSAEHSPYFAYVPAGSDLVHNANLLVCATLARLDALEPDVEAEAMAREAAGATLRRQRDDGLWAYGERGDYGWVDNFHTVYVLEALARIDERWGIGRDELRLGVDAWRSAFLDEDGWARYYPERRHPLEPQCCAAAIELLCDRAAGPGRADHVELARRIAATAIRELWLPGESRFAFQRTARGLNRRDYMRWTNAPMFRALTRLRSVGAQSS